MVESVQDIEGGLKPESSKRWWEKTSAPKKRTAQDDDPYLFLAQKKEAEKKALAMQSSNGRPTRLGSVLRNIKIDRSRRQTILLATAAIVATPMVYATIPLLAVFVPVVPALLRLKHSKAHAKKLSNGDPKKEKRIFWRSFLLNAFSWGLYEPISQIATNVSKEHNEKTRAKKDELLRLKEAGYDVKELDQVKKDFLTKRVVQEDLKEYLTLADNPDVDVQKTKWAEMAVKINDSTELCDFSPALKEAAAAEVSRQEELKKIQPDADRARPGSEILARYTELKNQDTRPDQGDVEADIEDRQPAFEELEAIFDPDALKARKIEEQKEALNIDGIETPPNPNEDADPEAGSEPKTEPNAEAKAGNEPPSERPKTGRSIIDEAENPASQADLPKDGGAIKFDRNGIPADALSISKADILTAKEQAARNVRELHAKADQTPKEQLVEAVAAYERAPMAESLAKNKFSDVSLGDITYKRRALPGDIIIKNTPPKKEATAGPKV